MKIGPAGLTKLSEMICGDPPFTFFPYRSSAYLNQFFHDVDVDYVHDGSTRRHWVRSVLVAINNRPSSETMPSPKMVKIIEYVLHSDHFAVQDTNRKRALEAVNVTLKAYGLKVTVAKTGQAKLVPASPAKPVPETRVPEKAITFCPEIFRVPAKRPQPDLVSVMMPFLAEFNPTYDAIRTACAAVNLKCLRADDIWENTTVIQDIFELIYCSRAVVADFSGKNPNVMYETGIAHTLGKHVIPITQAVEDIPFDIRHHRVLKYLPNKEGYASLSSKLESRLRQIFFPGVPT